MVLTRQCAGRPAHSYISGRGNEIRLHFKESRPALEPPSPRTQRVPELNRPAREAGYSPPYSAELGSAWSCASGPPYSIVLMACPDDFASAFAFRTAPPRCSLMLPRAVSHLVPAHPQIIFSPGELSLSRLYTPGRSVSLCRPLNKFDSATILVLYECHEPFL